MSSAVNESEGTTWKVNEKCPSDFTRFRAVVNTDSIVAFSDEETQFFEVQEDRLNLIRTVYASEDDIWKKAQILRVIPGTSWIAYVKPGAPSHLVVQNLKEPGALTEKQLEGNILRINCSPERVLVTVFDKTIRKSFLFQWNCEDLVLQKEWPWFRSFPTIARNGVVAYRPNKDLRIHLYNSLIDEDLGTISPESEFKVIKLGPDGSILSVQELNFQLILYDVTSKNKIFECFTFDSIVKYSLSDNCKTIMIVGDTILERVQTFSLMHLKRDSAGEQLILDFDYTLQADYMDAKSVAFRTINGLDHLQCVTFDGVLKLFRLDVPNQQWILVE